MHLPPYLFQTRRTKLNQDTGLVRPVPNQYVGGLNGGGTAGLNPAVRRCYEKQRRITAVFCTIPATSSIVRVWSSSFSWSDLRPSSHFRIVENRATANAPPAESRNF